MSDHGARVDAAFVLLDEMRRVGYSLTISKLASGERGLQIRPAPTDAVRPHIELYREELVELLAAPWEEALIRHRLATEVQDRDES